jgi:gliding motility-associated protein GldL
MGFIQSLQSKKGKKFMGYLYGWGAAIVIIGAMFKIQHWPGAGAMLVCGLSIEAIIFFFSAFEPVHEETDWSLVYPELRGQHDDHDAHAAGRDKDEAARGLHGKKGDAVSQQLDKMLEEAKIGPELIESLGKGFQNLSEQASNLSNIGDATVATKDYIEGVKSATSNMGKLSDSYIKASSSLVDLSETNIDGKAYGEQLQQVSKNLSALNAVYELQLQGSQDQLKQSNKMFDNMSSMIKNLSESVEDTQKYKEEISKLAVNLGALNTVYGNMLTAMNFSK